MFPCGQTVAVIHKENFIKMVQTFPFMIAMVRLYAIEGLVTYEIASD